MAFGWGCRIDNWRIIVKLRPWFGVGRTLELGLTDMMKLHWLQTTFSVVALSLAIVGSATADEIVVDRNLNDTTVAGDFLCSNCPHQALNRYEFSGREHEANYITTGELWKFFNEKGVRSLDRITLFVDVESTAEDAFLDLRALEFEIDGPNQFGSLTRASFGKDTLLIPNYEISSLRPEAKLQVDLGYDFMKKFSADSSEKIRLSYVSSDAAVGPAFSIQAEPTFFSQRPQMIGLVAFSSFWIVVFFFLNRFTRPTQQRNSNSRENRPRSGAANVQPT